MPLSFPLAVSLDRSDTVAVTSMGVVVYPLVHTVVGENLGESVFTHGAAELEELLSSVRRELVSRHDLVNLCLLMPPVCVVRGDECP